MSESDVRNEALSNFGSSTPVVLATVDQQKPVQRRVTLVRAGARFYLITFTGSRKVAQLDENSAYAALLSLDEGENHGYVELTGTVRKVESRSEKVEVGEIAGFIEKYWRDIDDPDLTMYELVVDGGRYMKPGSWKALEFNLS